MKKYFFISIFLSTINLALACVPDEARFALFKIIKVISSLWMAWFTIFAISLLAFIYGIVLLVVQKLSRQTFQVPQILFIKSLLFIVLLSGVMVFDKLFGSCLQCGEPVCKGGVEVYYEAYFKK